MRAARLTGIFVAGILVAMYAAGDDSGTPPRSKPADYPVHESVKAAELAAVLISPEQVKRMFSAEVAKAYMVVEIAVYPADGHSFDVNVLDYSLRVGNQVIHAEKPENVMIPWGNTNNSGPTIGSRGPTVNEDAGVIVAHGTDPMTGRPRTAVGTYDEVGVTNAPRPADQPVGNKPDQTALYNRIRDKAVPEGGTVKPVAGYLYFPQYGKRRKNDPVALNYSKDEISVDLKFPK
jgi:hypothetical protein